MTDPKVTTGLELNRLFYEGRGDAFIDTFADYVERGGIVVGEESLIRLFDAVRAVQPIQLKTRNSDS